MKQTIIWEANDIIIHIANSSKHNNSKYYSITYYRKGFGVVTKSVSKKTALYVAKKFNIKIY